MQTSSATEPAVAHEPAASQSLGLAFAQALSRKDFDQVATLLHPEIDFRALTPRRNWEASGARSVVQDVLRVWFGESDELGRLVGTETDSVADRDRVAYRFEGRNPDGPFVVEQQAYYTARDSRIVWMRVLCSGFRPRPMPETQAS
jgi:SnoaL-like protein